MLSTASDGARSGIARERADVLLARLRTQPVAARGWYMKNIPIGIPKDPPPPPYIQRLDFTSHDASFMTKFVSVDKSANTKNEESTRGGRCPASR